MFGRINDPKSYLILSLETGMKDSYTTTNSNTVINTLRPRQNGRHFADDALKRISLYENVRMLDQVTSYYLHQGYITDAYMRHSASMGQHGISQYIFSFKKIFLDLSSLMLPSLWNREIDMHCVRIYHTNLFSCWLRDKGFLCFRSLSSISTNHSRTRTLPLIDQESRNTSRHQSRRQSLAVQ